MNEDDISSTWSKGANAYLVLEWERENSLELERIETIGDDGSISGSNKQESKLHRAVSVRLKQEDGNNTHHNQRLLNLEKNKTSEMVAPFHAQYNYVIEIKDQERETFQSDCDQDAIPNNFEEKLFTFKLANQSNIQKGSQTSFYITDEGVSLRWSRSYPTSNAHMTQLSDSFVPVLSADEQRFRDSFCLVFHSALEHEVFWKCLQDAYQNISCHSSIMTAERNSDVKRPCSTIEEISRSCERDKHKSGIVIQIRLHWPQNQHLPHAYILSSSLEESYYDCVRPREMDAPSTVGEQATNLFLIRSSEHGQNWNAVLNHDQLSKKQAFRKNFLSHGGRFFLLTPEDRQLTTDYQFLIFSQVTRGVLNEQDLNKPNRKRNLNMRIGYLGLRCRHCGGNDRGQYFPSTCKNLQVCASMIFTHLSTCSQCPIEIRSILPAVKFTHRSQASDLRPGLQSIFYSRLWSRVQDETYEGGNRISTEIVLDIICNLLSSSDDLRYHVNLISSAPWVSSGSKFQDDGIRTISDSWCNHKCMHSDTIHTMQKFLPDSRSEQNFIISSTESVGMMSSMHGGNGTELHSPYPVHKLGGVVKKEDKQLNTNSSESNLTLILEAMKQVECNHGIGVTSSVSRTPEAEYPIELRTPEAEVFFNFPSPPYHPVATMQITPRSLEKVAFSLFDEGNR